MKSWYFLGMLFLCPLFCACDKNDIYHSEWVLQPIDKNMNRDSEYIVVIGDIQNYTDIKAYSAYYKGTMCWIWSQHQQGINIKCVLQVGDITNGNAQHQYETFYEYTIPVANIIPYIACIGNHDYEWNSDFKIEDRNRTFFSDYTSFELAKSLVVGSFESGRMENIVVEITLNGSTYYVLSLEFGARHEVVEWAKSFVRGRPDRRFILMTHEYLSRNGERVSADSYAELQFRNTTWSTPEELWTELIKDNDNIVCVLCGHNGFSCRQFSLNSHGRLVPQVLFNLQYQEHGGDGLVQLWEFPQNGDSVYVDVYNTIYREWFADEASTKFSFRYKY